MHMPKILARKSASNVGELFIYDDIGESFFSAGVTAEAVVEKVKALGSIDELNVRINSQGGEVFEGLTIFNYLNQHPARIIVDIDGAALSIASIIAMAGDEVRIAKNAMMMIHNARTGVMGGAKEMREMANRLDKVNDSLAITYSGRRGIDVDTVAHAMAKETWFTASEAAQFGLVDQVTASVEVVTNLDETRFMNAPAWAVNRAHAGGSRSVFFAKTMNL
jgi:ATP-dependent Clp protease protease subunit